MIVPLIGLVNKWTLCRARYKFAADQPSWFAYRIGLQGAIMARSNVWKSRDQLTVSSTQDRSESDLLPFYPDLLIEGLLLWNFVTRSMQQTTKNWAFTLHLPIDILHCKYSFIYCAIHDLSLVLEHACGNLGNVLQWFSFASRWIYGWFTLTDQKRIAERGPSVCQLVQQDLDLLLVKKGLTVRELMNNWPSPYLATWSNKAYC